jgi:prepilin-type N-terminal cleavage/methylation domain-containing protein
MSRTTVTKSRVMGGFTLVEILISMSLIAVMLTVLVVVSFQNISSSDDALIIQRARTALRNALVMIDDTQDPFILSFGDDFMMIQGIYINPSTTDIEMRVVDFVDFSPLTIQVPLSLYTNQNSNTLDAIILNGQVLPVAIDGSFDPNNPAPNHFIEFLNEEQELAGRLEYQKIGALY